MIFKDFNEYYLCEFEPSEKDKYLFELAEEYHKRTEEYDLSVCTGRMGQDGILPADEYEYRLINRNAIQILKSLKQRAFERGIEGREVQRAISNWHLTSQKQRKKL